MLQFSPRQMTVMAVVGAVFIVIVALRIGFGRVAQESDEHFLERLPAELASRAERRDLKALRSWVSREYRDGSGRGYDQLNQMLIGHFIRQGTISVYTIDTQVSVDRTADPWAADIETKTLMTRHPRVEKLSDILPETARALKVRLQLRKTDGDWKIHAADWSDIKDVRSLLF